MKRYQKKSARNTRHQPPPNSTNAGPGCNAVHGQTPKISSNILRLYCLTVNSSLSHSSVHFKSSGTKTIALQKIKHSLCIREMKKSSGAVASLSGRMISQVMQHKSHLLQNLLSNSCTGDQTLSLHQRKWRWCEGKQGLQRVANELKNDEVSIRKKPPNENIRN